jgi:hypothetical protein
MGFKATAEVEALDYDFAPHAPLVKGVTPEPSDKLIGQYWKGYGKLIREHARLLEEWQTKLDTVDQLPSETEAQRELRMEARRKLDEQFEAWQGERAEVMRSERIRLVAEVCSQKPSVEELVALPGRVYDGFEQYMQGELTPKGRRNGLN